MQSQSENRPVSPAKVQPQFSGDPVITIEESSHLFSPSDPLLAGETGTTSVKITMTPSGSNTRDERNLEENKSSPALDEDSLKVFLYHFILKYIVHCVLCAESMEIE